MMQQRQVKTQSSILRYNYIDLRILYKMLLHILMLEEADMLILIGEDVVSGSCLVLSAVDV
jgi:hypothetical protein